MTSEDGTREQQLGFLWAPPSSRSLALRLAPRRVPVRAAVGVALLPSDWRLGRVFSPGREGSGALSTQICFSSSDEGLRVYTTNSAILKAERERHTQLRAWPAPPEHPRRLSTQNHPNVASREGLRGNRVTL